MSVTTRQLWAVLSANGLIYGDGGGLAVFLKKADAERWAHNNCSARPRIQKFVLGDRRSDQEHRMSNQAASNTDSPEWMKERIKYLEGQLRESPIQCDCHPGVRWPYAIWGESCPITQRDRRIAELEAALEAACIDLDNEPGLSCGKNSRLVAARALLAGKSGSDTALRAIVERAVKSAYREGWLDCHAGVAEGGGKVATAAIVNEVLGQ